VGDLAAYRAAQMKSITTYAWIDKEHGVVRIPVEEAMRVLLEKGLPVAPQGGEPAPAQEPKK